jgi:glycosyltransferase involved in cell wall biosynthesis
VYRADFAAYLAARPLGLPLVATFHGRTGGSWRNRAYEWIDRRLLARFDAVACVSRSARDWLVRARVPVSRLRVVQNGYRPVPLLDRGAARERLGLDQGAFTAGWVGRLSPEKGPDLLIEAMALLRDEPVRVAVLGDGPERERLATLVRSHALAPSAVRFNGLVLEAPAMFAAFDALVLSSRTEGLPMVLLEAMSAGVPIVAFAVGGIPEVLSNDTAWLVTPGDPRALAGALRDVAHSPAEAQRRAQAARRVFVDRFTDLRWVAEMEEVYASVLARRVPAGEGGAAGTSSAV